MFVNKGIISILSLIAMSSFLNAETENKTEELNTTLPVKKVVDNSFRLSDYISITGISSYDQMSVDKIEGADIIFDPVISAGIKIIFFPDLTDSRWFSNITLGYQKSFSKNEIAKEGFQESEQINLEVPIPKTNFTLRYDRNTFSTSIQAKDRTVYLMDRTNSTAITDNVSINDDGVIKLNKNDAGLLETVLTKYELRYYPSKSFYWSFFKEDMVKPWENPVSQWRSPDGEPLTSIFSQTKFESYGIGVGLKTEDRFLHEGMNVSKLRGSISKSEIFLTDNYNLDDRVDGYSAMRYSIGGEIAYKLKFGVISKNSALVLAIYGNYDSFDYTKDDDTSTDNDVELSNDYKFGARVALSF